MKRKRTGHFTAAVVLPAVALVCLCGPAAGAGMTTAVRQRLALEEVARDNPFLLLPHRPNYILPLTYSTGTNAEPFGLEEGDLDRLEMKFQVSLKISLAEHFLGGDGSLYAAYTNRSWWQSYNTGRSRPFRETNHEPELFLLYDTDWEVAGARITSVILGLSHQSNGQAGSLSRSWNRVYASLIMEKGATVVSLKPWYRIPEPQKADPSDPRGDDNPDIEKYMGNAEAGLLYRRNRHSLTLMARNNFRKQNRGAVELGWAFPLSGRLKGTLQVFDGYGESLIDYDRRTTRIGVGFLLSDWL